MIFYCFALFTEAMDISGPYTHKDYTRAVHPLLDSLMFFDESVQVNGINYLVDFRDVSMNHLTWVGVEGLKSAAEIASVSQDDIT